QPRGERPHRQLARDNGAERWVGAIDFGPRKQRVYWHLSEAIALWVSEQAHRGGCARAVQNRRSCRYRTRRSRHGSAQHVVSPVSPAWGRIGSSGRSSVSDRRTWCKSNDVTGIL